MRAAGVLAFGLLGVYLSVRLLAALHAVRDLWYARGRCGPRLARGLLGWGGIAAALTWWLGPPCREALLWGLGGYTLFYLSLFPLRDFGLRALVRRPRPWAFFWPLLRGFRQRAEPRRQPASRGLGRRGGGAVGLP